MTARLVKLCKFEEETGYSPNSVHQKIKKGVWAEGIHYVKAPDGHILVNLEEYERWARGDAALKTAAQA